MFARAGLIVMMAVDTMMVGHAGGQELAFFSIGLAPQMALLVTGIGLLVGTVVLVAQADGAGKPERSEEHTSELQSLMRISYDVFCLKKKKENQTRRSVNKK